MAGVQLISCQELFNLLNQFFKWPFISQPNYLLLLDARSWEEYEFQHLETAKYAPRSAEGAFQIPYGAELECKQNVVVYDGSSSELPENIYATGKTDSSRMNRALECALELHDTSKNPIKILAGGFELFSAGFHFLRTQKMIYMPRELEAFKTYPIEIIHGLLYLGNEEHGNDPDIQKNLKIKGHVICQEEYSKIAPPYCDYVLHLPIEDSSRADIASEWTRALDFIEGYIDGKLQVLVWGQNETSRAATIVTAYLMRDRKWGLERALNLVRGCHVHARPNRGFLEQLLALEKELLDEPVAAEAPTEAEGTSSGSKTT